MLRQLRTHGYVSRRGHDQSLLDIGRLAIGELAASVRFERRHPAPTAVPITVHRTVDALRGALPLVSLPRSMDGICEFVVRDSSAAQGARAAACWMEVEEGRVVSAGLGNAPKSASVWVQGTIDDWLAAVIDRRAAHLRASGERDLGKSLIDGLHAELYG
jgi:hypothetical protein